MNSLLYFFLYSNLIMWYKIKVDIGMKPNQLFFIKNIEDMNSQMREKVNISKSQTERTWNCLKPYKPWNKKWYYEFLFRIVSYAI